MNNQQPTDLPTGEDSKVDAIAAVVLIFCVAGLMLLWVASH